MARPDLWGWTAIVLAVFGAMNVLLVRAVFAWIDRWLAQRRTRELVSAVFLVGLLSLQLLNPAFHMQRGKVSNAWQAQGARWLKAGQAVQNWLPPGLAGLVVTQAVEQRPAKSAEAMAGLGFYALAVGGVLAVRLRAGYRGESLSDAPAREAAASHARTGAVRARGGQGAGAVTGYGRVGGSGPIAAVMEKELRTLLRSLPLLYAVGAPVFMVFIFSGLFARRHAGGGAPAMGLMISLAYAFVGFTQLFYNNLGPEGAGVQLLFLAPTPMRKVVLAKNLFHAGLFGMAAVLVCVAASLRLGVPSAPVLAGTAAWLLFALPVHLTAGNAFSLNMPYRMNLGRIGKQRGSQISALLSMLIQGGVLGIGVGVFALCSYLSRLWMAVPVFLVLAAAAVFAWLRVLGSTNEMAERRKEALLSALARVD
jgi:ABC-2 type transport system permease protein